MLLWECFSVRLHTFRIFAYINAGICSVGKIIKIFLFIVKAMLVYNTTYHVQMSDARNFVIWLSESYIPEAEKTGDLKNPRILRILSHQEQDSECFSLQWEVESSAALHHWHTKVGAALNEEMMKIFKDQVLGFPTLMEVIK